MEAERETAAVASDRDEEEDPENIDQDFIEDDRLDEDDYDGNIMTPPATNGAAVGADAWDDTCYTANSFNEALASELFGRDNDDDVDLYDDRVTDDASSSSREDANLPVDADDFIDGHFKMNNE
jgi:hypothetical protein